MQRKSDVGWNYPRYKRDLRMKDWDVMLVSHEASRTGAPRVAVDLAKGFVNAGLRVLVILRWDGPLRVDFESTGATVVTEPGRHLRVFLRRFRTGKRLALSWENLMVRWAILRYRPRSVYLNTALSLPFAGPALAMQLPVAVHLHEVDDWLSHALARYPLTQKQAESIRWAHCAQRSADLLRHRYRSVQSKFIPSGIDTERVREAATSPSNQSLPSQYIVNCGTADHRKGVDIWLRLCEALYATSNWNQLHFVWIGKVTQSELIDPYRKRPFFNHVHFVGETANPYPVLRQADLMVFPTRQDAYPLVVMEAQALGVPVIAFDVGDIKDQIPSHHLVRCGNETELLNTVLHVLNEKSPTVAFDNNRHSITIVRQSALALLAPTNHTRIDK